MSTDPLSSCRPGCPCGCLHGTGHAKLGLLQTAHWLQHRRIAAAGDVSFAAIELLAAVRRLLPMVSRLKLDAAFR